MAGAIYYGCLGHNDKRFHLFNERIDECANDFVFAHISHEFRALLQCIYAYHTHGILPVAGGYLDQSPIFHDALSAFAHGKSYFGEQKEKLREKLRALGA